MRHTGTAARLIQAFAFYLFAAVVLTAGAMTIASRNPVHSVLWLILAFFNAAGLMVLAGAEFIAMLLVIVYVGAVAVLFLFVVMMLNIDFAELRAGFARYLPLGLVLGIALAAEITIGLGAWSAGGIELGARPVVSALAVDNVRAVGLLLYSRYLFVFELAGFVLLVAMIGAIVLTQRPRVGSKAQSIARQNARRPEDATRLVDAASGEGVRL